MLKKLSQGLYKISNFRTGLLITLLYAGFIATVMPEQSAVSSTYAGDWGAPDRHLFYTPDELYTAIATWGETGRADYVRFRLGLDILWALAYSGFLIIWISCALHYALLETDKRRLWNTVPLIALLSDYAENAAGILLMTNYPQRMDLLAWLATITTGTKWISLTIAHLVLLYALSLALQKKFRQPASADREP